MKNFSLLAVIAAALYGCSRPQPDAPPQARYGQDECAHCGMIVSDERHAAALRITRGGQSQDLFFDDIGDMIDYERENAPELKVTHRFVHDFQTRQWIDANSAVFVKDETVHTPMGSGIIAFAHKPSDRSSTLTLQDLMNPKKPALTSASAD